MLRRTISLVAFVMLIGSAFAPWAFAHEGHDGVPDSDGAFGYCSVARSGGPEFTIKVRCDVAHDGETVPKIALVYRRVSDFNSSSATSHPGSNLTLTDKRIDLTWSFDDFGGDGSDINWGTAYISFHDGTGGSTMFGGEDGISGSAAFWRMMRTTVTEGTDYVDTGHWWENGTPSAPPPPCVGYACFVEYAIEIGDCTSEVYPSILMGLAKVESSYNANPGPSSAGAEGPFQFLPSTWNDGWARDHDGDGIADIWSIPDAMKAAKDYLTYLVDRKGGDIRGALLAYNGASSPNGYDEKVITEAKAKAELVDMACTNSPYNDGSGGGGDGPVYEECSAINLPCWFRRLFIPQVGLTDHFNNIKDTADDNYPIGPLKWTGALMSETMDAFAPTNECGHTAQPDWEDPSHDSTAVQGIPCGGSSNPGPAITVFEGTALQETGRVNVNWMYGNIPQGANCGYSTDWMGDGCGLARTAVTIVRTVSSAFLVIAFGLVNYRRFQSMLAGSAAE